MAKNVPIAFNRVSLCDLTSYEDIFSRFGHIFDRNKTKPKEIQEQPITYLPMPVNSDLRELDPRYKKMKTKNSGLTGAKALLPRAVREIREMNQTYYKEDVLIENPDNEQNHW